MRSFDLTQPNLPKKIIRYELSAGVAQDVYAKNYSTVKSSYGLDSLGDGTFTGDSILGYDGSPATIIYTDTGEVLLDELRYRDTSTSATLISIDTTVATISTSPVSDSSTWLTVESGDSLSRYIKSDIDTVVTLQIGPSLISSMLTETALLAATFPSWTDIYDDTTSNGQLLLNALGIDIEEVKKQAISWSERGHINSIPTGIKAFAYLSELPDLDKPIDVIGGFDASPALVITLSPAEDLKEFIEAEDTKDLYFIEDRYLFTSRLYDSLTIDSIEYPQETVIIRNFFDYIGDYIDLPRLENETNANYKTRLLDVFNNPPGASKELFEKAVKRESGCSISNVWELSDSSLPWETNDPATSGVFYAPATNEHVDIAKWCREEGAIGFDYFLWGKALWDMYPKPWDVGEIPHLLDISLTELSLTQKSGYGYGNDLLPSRYTQPDSMNYMVTLYANGYIESTETITPPVIVSGRVVPSATLTEYHNEFDGYLALKITTDESPTGIYYKNFSVSIPRDSGVAVNGNTFYIHLPQFYPSEQTITCSVYNDSEEELVEVSLDTIIQYDIYDGRWDFVTASLDSNSPSGELTISMGTVGLSWVVANQSDIHPDIITVTHSTAALATISTWTGIGAPFILTCNENSSISNASIPVPRNTEEVANLGTITYTIIVDSVEPDEASLDASPAVTTIEFSTGGMAHVGWPESTVTIDLSSTYSEDVTVLTPSTHASTQIFSGTLTTDSPVKKHTVTTADWGFPADFVGARYGTSVTGEVIVRIPAEIGATSDDLVVELNPVYMYEWHPCVLPGTLYIDSTEYYLHANEITENVTGTTYALVEPIAPGTILSFSEALTELHFTDSDGNPTLTITQEVEGNGTRYLPIWYENAVSIEVEGVSKSLLSGPGITVGNIVDNVTETVEGTFYTVEYQVTDSYCVDYAYLINGEYRPYISLQAAHPGLTVTYTPYADSYNINTGVATNPLFTYKNKDFLYITNQSVTPTSIQIITKPPILYRGESHPIFVFVSDADGNGVPGVDATITCDDSQTAAIVTNLDGYASALITGTDEGLPLPTELVITATIDDSSPAITDTVTFQIQESYYNSPAKLYVLEQSFQVAQASQQVPQVITLLLLDDSGLPVQDTGTYEIWCSNSSGVVASTPISSNSNGILSLSNYTPTYAGQYVATFAINNQTLELGWQLVERI